MPLSMRTDKNKSRKNADHIFIFISNKSITKYVHFKAVGMNLTE